MEHEVVRRRGWLTRDEFLDLLAATNLIPGPNSTEMAIYIGRRQAGWAGLLVAGACFIVPAAMITLVLAWTYVRFGTLPAAGGFLYGVKPVVLAIVLHALWSFGRSALATRGLAALGLLALAATVLGAHELAVLAGAGLLAVLAQAGWPATGRAGGASLFSAALAPVLPPLPAGTGGLAAATPFSLGTLLLFFLKTGSVMFGSGYVLLAFLRADLVDRWHWLTEQTLLDAVAVGQLTPGPLSTTATFIGYVLGGVPGAAVATAGMFVPSFVFVALSAPLLPRLRRSRTAGAFLDGVVVASLALMTLVTWQLGRAAVVDIPSAGLAVASTLLLVRREISSAWLVLGGGLIGLAIAGAR
jgi:chromate transporter